MNFSPHPPHPNPQRAATRRSRHPQTRPSVRSSRWALLLTVLLAALLALLASCTRAPSLMDADPELASLEVRGPAPHELVFSAVQGSSTAAERVHLRNTGTAPLTLSRATIVGTDADAFTLNDPPQHPLVIEPQGGLDLWVRFAPRTAGVKQAALQLVSNDLTESVLHVGLYGLGARGEQGTLEPSLHEVVTTLGHAIDVGGTDLVLGTGSEGIGDEVLIPLFERASSGPVRLTPVARYGPEEVLPFGFFTLPETTGGAQPQRREVGRVAAEHAQMLYPPLQNGSDSFDPGEGAFGVYARAGGHEQYSLDALNEGGVKHALRVYPLKDRGGRTVPHSYLLGLEEAKNGDYQDAVFVLSNVKPAASQPTPNEPDGWTPLFNGYNLDGWYTYLPSEGKNSDPEGVFKVENGLLHILDVEKKGYREFGYVATEREFENYHLRLEYRWGEKRFAPRDRAKRDSGVIYHTVGPDKVWPRGVEYQIQERDTGDFWMIGGTTLSTTVASRRTSNPRYRQNGEPFKSRPGDFVRLVKDGTHDSKGGWNTAEIIVRGNSAVHIINGRVNNRAYSLYQPGPNGESVPLTKGRILLQAEGAEVFYRNVEIRPL